MFTRKTKWSSKKNKKILSVMRGFFYLNQFPIEWKIRPKKVRLLWGNGPKPLKYFSDFEYPPI